MKWLLIFVTLFVTLFITGCATKQPNAVMQHWLNDLEQEKQDTWKPTPNGMGWQALSEDGYLWIYRTERGIQAVCAYSYMKVSDVEQWDGTMQKMKTDFMGGTQTVQESGLPNLAGCVEWVNHHLIGDYFI